MENFDKVIWQTRLLSARKMWQIICWFVLPFGENEEYNLHPLPVIQSL